jgi:hypothetical protein
MTRQAKTTGLRELGPDNRTESLLKEVESDGLDQAADAWVAQER